MTLKKKKERSSRRDAIDMRAIAFKAMDDYGFRSRFSQDVIREVDLLAKENGPPEVLNDIRDLRQVLWSSIDNEESEDLDQIEYCENTAHGSIRVRVAIADVDHRVPRSSLSDEHAGHNATSVYTGVEVFPMIPKRLCYDLTSLRNGEDRRAIVLDFYVKPEGQVRFNDVYLALVNNKAKLVYETVGDWLEGRGPIPKAVAEVPGLKQQILLQDEAAGRLRRLRLEKGALELDTIEAKPVFEDGAIKDLVVQKKNRARFLIENLMIAANMTMNWFLEMSSMASIDRVLPHPDVEEWQKVRVTARRLGEKLPEIPDSKALSEFLSRRHKKAPDRFADLSLTIVKLLGAGEYVCSRPQGPSTEHFGLAIQDYTHSTAPNRRYVDLVLQRLLKSVLAKDKSPYSFQELGPIASWCSQQSKAAKKVERFMRKVAAAILLMDRIGESFEGIVTGASAKGTYVRVFRPPVEGRVIRKFERMQVGEYVRVRLVGLEYQRGHIDFEGVKS